MMHRFFYRNFSVEDFQNPLLLLFGGFAAGSLTGCLCFCMVPEQLSVWLCSGLLTDSPGVLSPVLCGLLPFCLAGGICLVCPWRPAWLLPAALCGFLLSFAACVFAAGCGGAGWLIAAALLAGRCASLPPLFWFLLRRMELGNLCLARDFLLACGLGVALQLVFIWLLSPALGALSQFVFI